jgi:hypothetical protein
VSVAQARISCIEPIDARQEQFKAAAEPAVREWLAMVDRESARLSEFAVDLPLSARRPLTSTEREVAAALLTTLEVLERTAQQLSADGDPTWEGWADAATWLSNDIGRRGLPQLSRVSDEIGDLDDAEAADEHGAEPEGH